MKACESKTDTHTQTHWDISVYMYECTRHNVLNLIQGTLNLTIQSHKRLSYIVNEKESNSNVQPLLTFGCIFFSIECNMPLFKLVGFVYEIHLLMDVHFVHCHHRWKTVGAVQLKHVSYVHQVLKIESILTPLRVSNFWKCFFVFLIVRFQFIHQ